MWEDHGVSYDDIRIERADWWTGGVKAEYAKRGLSVFGQLPVVVVDGVRMVQSYVYFWGFSIMCLTLLRHVGLPSLDTLPSASVIDFLVCYC